MNAVKDGALWHVDAEVALEVACHEALVRQTYKDSVGINTWCVGMTNATGHRVERYIGKPASLQHCMNLYVWALDNYAAAVRKAFAGVKISKAQFAAALSFHWNTGGIGRATWVTHFRAGRMPEARAAFMSWNKPSEIIGRRGKERDLFFGGKWSNNGTMIEYTRVTARMTPDWGSARRINVSKELAAAFGQSIADPADQPPQTDAVPEVPTLTPTVDPSTAPKTGLAAIIIAIVAALAGAVAFLTGD